MAQAASVASRSVGSEIIDGDFRPIPGRFITLFQRRYVSIFLAALWHIAEQGDKIGKYDIKRYLHLLTVLHFKISGPP